MVVKTLTEVATKKEKQFITDIEWGHAERHGETGTATVTGLWREGCAIKTKQNLFSGETIWLKLKKQNAEQTLWGTVIWVDNCHRADGNCYEIRLRRFDPQQIPKAAYKKL